MPVIRDTARETTQVPSSRRSKLLNTLRQVLDEPGTCGGPVVFEIPLAGLRHDVLVVWEEWDGVQPDERTDIIVEAYSTCSNTRIEIAQAMGVTRDEAIRDHLLPYLIQPCAREGEVSLDDLREAMLKEGGISLGENKVDLRFPTRPMAEAAFERLRKEMPTGYWSLAEEHYNFM